MRMLVAAPLAALLGWLVVYAALKWTEPDHAANVTSCENAARKLRIEAREARDMCSGLNKRDVGTGKPANDI